MAKSKVSNDTDSLSTENKAKEVVESYVFSTARRDVGIHGERLLLRLVEIAQSQVAGLDFKSGRDIGKVRVSDWGDAQVTIPVKDILSGEKDKNYERAKMAVMDLMTKVLQYEDDNVYQAAHILNNVDLNKVSGSMVITVNRQIWSAMLDFSKGFRKYDLFLAMKLKSRYSIRLYKLISKQTDPITYTIDYLRKEWNLEDKYKKVDDFIKSTIGKAKEELDRVSPYSFDYTLNSSRSADVNKKRKGRPSITSVTIFPVHILQNETSDMLRNRVDPSMLISAEAYKLLKEKFDFNFAGIKANLQLFETADKYSDLTAFLYRIAPAALRAQNVQGYVVNALKKHLREDLGIGFDGASIIQGEFIKRKNLVQSGSRPTSLGELQKKKKDINVEIY